MDINVEVKNNRQNILANVNQRAGEGTVSNYNELDNKPKINNVTLVGNKTLEDLGIENYDDTEIIERLDSIDSDMLNKVDKELGKGLSTNDFTTDLKNKLNSLENYDDTEIENKIQAINDTLDTLSDVATTGSYNDLTNKPNLFDGNYNSLTNKPTLFSGDYNDLENKPTIPQPYTLPVASLTQLGGIKVDGNTITINSNGVISASSSLNIDVVETLPTTDISTSTIYLVRRIKEEENNIYDEYIYIDDNWELIGSTDVDLSNYVTTTQLTSELSNYALSNSLSTVATSGSYNDLANKPTLFSGNYNDLSNKPTNVSSFTNDAGYLTQHQSLSDYATKSYVDDIVGNIEGLLGGI